MNRIERHHVHQPKSFFYKGLLLSLVFITGLIFTTNVYMKSKIQIEAPKEDLGRQVIIQMPNKKEIHTYENFITEKEGKLFYEGERNTIDITGGKVLYQNWK